MIERESDAIKMGKARIIHPGDAKGRVLKSPVPVGFFGHLDPASGVYREKGHPLDGKSTAGRILVFPKAKGSTVGSYTIYGLSRSGNGPAAMLLEECDTIVAVGAIIGEVPTMDCVDISSIPDGAFVRVKDGIVSIEEI